MRGAIERVIVTLDASTDNRTSIDTAARLAAHAKSPLHGVFVEDQELLHLAVLPFARQVTIGAGTESLTHADVALQMLAQAAQARRQLHAAARQHHVKWSFEIVRGKPGTAATSASIGDLVVVGAQTRPIAGYFCVERRWSAIEPSTGPVLLARLRWAPAGSVVTLLRDRDDASARLLEAAGQVAAAKNGTLHVICSASLACTDGFDQWIAERVPSQQVRPQIEVAPGQPQSLHERLLELNCRLLALEAGSVEGAANSLRAVAERFACDMLIVP